MTASGRIDLVDALRGYALFGLFMVHCVERFELYWLAPAPDAWFDSVFALFAGKSFAIFALLFGFSFATIMANERGRGGDYTWRFGWRLVLLFAIGTFHALVYRGDILQVLALIGLVMIPFDRVRSDRLLLAVVALLFVQLPLLWRAWAAGHGAAWATADPLFWGDSGLATLASGSLPRVLSVNAGAGMASKWSFYLETGRVVEIAGLFLVGMLLHRRGLFARASERLRFWFVVLAAGAAAWLMIALLRPRVQLGDAPPMTGQSIAWAFDQYGALAATSFQVAAFVIVWHTPLRRVLAWLAPAGRTTLTLYVGQSLLMTPLLYGYGAGLWDAFSDAEMVLIGLVLFSLQLVVAALWLRVFRYGPLEWLWRAATRTTLAVPFRA